MYDRAIFDAENMTYPKQKQVTGGGFVGEIAGSIADFGTFLPLILGVLALGTFGATGILVGFGLFALAVAAVYRRPIPIQPMKAIAALIIVGALTPAEMMASGLTIGAVMLALAVSGLTGRIARMVPGTVIAGIQLGVGAHLAMIGFDHIVGDPSFGVAALAMLGVLYFTRWRAVSCIAVFAGAVAFSFWNDPLQLQGVHLDWSLPGISFPAFADFEQALLIAVLPQLALTFSNAVIATSAIAAEYFPKDKDRMSANRLAASTGVLNLVLAPFGAMPMCHGSGGLVAQYGFGARRWIAPALFGAVCLSIGLAFGTGAQAILAVLPLSALGAMLAIAGAEMALGRRVLDAKPLCRAIIIATGLCCVVFNVAVGLFVGLALELARSSYNKSRRGEAA